MTIETAKVSGWRCGAKITQDATGRHITLELDRNLGGMWPRVVIEATARPSETTSISVAAPGTSGETFDGFSGMSYTRCIHESCVAALFTGATSGLDGKHGYEIAITSGGVAVDTAEAICERAAEVAVRALTQMTAEGSTLAEVFEHCVGRWPS